MRGLVRRTDRGAINHGQEMLVDEHPFRQDASLIGSVQFAGEARPEIAVEIPALDPPDCVQIDRDPLMRDRAPGTVQLLMPIIDSRNIGRLERDAVEGENGHELPIIKRNHVVIHMARIGQILRRIPFELDRRFRLKHAQSLSASRQQPAEVNSWTHPKQLCSARRLSFGHRGTGF